MDLDKGLLQRGLELCVCSLKLFLGDVATADQVLHVESPDAALVFNQVVHQRLGHRWVIALVVTATAVADDVDDNVLLELLAILKGQT